MDSLFSPSLLLAWSTYFVMCASPGPAILAIMGTAMRSGRRPALIFSMGVLCGSVFWGLLTAFGLAALLTRYAQLLVLLKIAGGLYLLWLAFKSARSAIKPRALPDGEAEQIGALSARQLYLRGLALHLTNPKAILVWMSIVSLAFPQGGTISHALIVTAGCNVLGLLLFVGYALLFSTTLARRLYLSLRRWLEVTLAFAFGWAGLKLLALR